ncbi:phosphoribosylanthranilate isomerase [Thioalbus denitrificans]|uniref:N-(5'-phosphoribosyl)anthranilate isomerase n=1 Tax=Thioalbus denitrificans TaxID=547122 RepID=A0A369CIA3_9GAMM|nr:phosphoribosylanthranilate isomerase [Thioalbus denitrificans]RCX32177.1 phosphoribosylanthranilate isomerase [Thioalbus denitrificans]
MGRTRVKICGITRVDDAREAVRLGADAIGLVFHPPSPRHVNQRQAREIRAVVPAFVTVVGLFVDAEPERVREAVAAVPLDLLQFHGAEPPEYCRSHGRPYMKAVRMREGIDLHSECARYGDAAALLVDTYRPGVAGGTGETFDWSRIPRDLGLPLVLAGGLAPGNVDAAVRQVRPYAVDVSGGVEAAKGIKDPAKMQAFIRGVSRADTE